MKKRSYSKILDTVASDQVRSDLDLAPAILARIQKGKGLRMQPKTRLITAIVLLAITFAVLFYTVPAVKAAIERWFGYVPEVGLVHAGQVRVLAEPAAVTRDGVTVTVDQVVANQERTALVYSVEGIPPEAIVTYPDETMCTYEVTLRLPDGSSLLASPNGVQAWSSGYQHRFNYQALPAEINDVTLVIPCLFHTYQGSAPENWEIPLHLVPAAGEVTAFPVIEIPTPTAPAETGTPAEGMVGGSNPAPLSLTLDRAVQMDDGYLLYATLHWEDTPFASVSMTEPGQSLHLLDEHGNEMAYELVDDEQTGVKWDQRQTVLAIKTAPVESTGPLTVALDWVLVEVPSEGSFVIDPIENPQPGQRRQMDQVVTIGEHRLQVRAVTGWESGYEIEMTSDTGIRSAGCADHDHTVISGYSTEGSSNGENISSFGCGFNYESGLPAGPVTVTIGSISVQHAQEIRAEWTPPATSPTRMETPGAGCLTAEMWRQAVAQPPALPDGLQGKVLSYGPSNPENPDEAWVLAISALDGSERQVIDGADGGAFSPDGTRLAYSQFGVGIRIMDLASGQSTLLPGTGNGDFNPFWTPDGAQIVFNRGMGIFDLFLVNVDGTELRQLTQGGVQEWPVGWLQNGRVLLYSVPEQEYESTIYALDLQSGEAQVFSKENILTVSADEQQWISMETTFGEKKLVWIQGIDGTNRRLLTGTDMWLMGPNWSQDGKWLLTALSDKDFASTIGALINLETCGVYPLPGLSGSILSWAQ